MYTVTINNTTIAINSKKDLEELRKLLDSSGIFFTVAKNTKILKEEEFKEYAKNSKLLEESYEDISSLN